MDFVITNSNNYSTNNVDFQKIAYDVDLEYLIEEFNLNPKKIPMNFEQNYPNFHRDYVQLVREEEIKNNKNKGN